HDRGEGGGGIGDGIREHVGHLLVHGCAGAAVADHDGVGGALARHRGQDAVVLGDGQVGLGRQDVGVGGAVVARVGVGRAGRGRDRGGVTQGAGGGGVDLDREGEGDGGVDRQVDGGGQVAAAALRAGDAAAARRADERPGGGGDAGGQEVGHAGPGH